MTDKSSLLVTGASAGIGAVCFERPARRRGDVALIAHTTVQMKTLAGRLRGDTCVAIDAPPKLPNAGERAAADARLRADAQHAMIPGFSQPRLADRHLGSA